MKTYAFTIYQAAVESDNFEWWHTFKVQHSDPETAKQIAKAMFRNWVEWYILEFGGQCTTAIDYRKLDVLSFMPEQGIADSRGRCIWPINELRSTFECEDGRFYMLCDNDFPRKEFPELPNEFSDYSDPNEGIVP